LAVEFEMLLDVSRAGHHALLALVLPQIIQELALTISEFDGVSEHVNSVRANNQHCKSFFFTALTRAELIRNN
jgi:hypothetical protein